MYRTNDGQALVATQPADIVNELHGLSRSPAENDRAFMHDTAGRVQLQFGRRVRVDNAENFVADLLGLELLINEAEADA